jgi:hypothetical protein
MERDGIAARCYEVVAGGEVGKVQVEEAGLRGVGREAAKGLALACARHGEGRRLGWRYVRDGLRLLEGWVRANGGAYGAGDRYVSWFRESVLELDVCGMPLKALREVATGSEYADGGWAAGVLERKQAAGDNGYEVEYKEGRRFDLGVGALAGFIALDGEGPEQRMAVADHENYCVRIIHVGSGERVATAGSRGEGPGQFRNPCGVAFSGTGELYVSDYALHRISVFDRQGRYVRGIGGPGGGQGQLKHPRGICFTADGDLVVADSENHRVKVFREDGTFVRAIGSVGSGEGQLKHPRDVCGRPDGSIAVLDNSNCRVQVFDMEGGFVRSIGSLGDGPGQLLNPHTMAVGKSGEIIVTDCERQDVQVFSAEGELLQIIGPEGDSKVALQGTPYGVAACADGRLLVTLDDQFVVMLC